MKTTITQNQIFETFSRLQRSCCSAVFLLLFLLSASSSWGQTTVPITATGTGTWTCPAGVTSITVECWGGGGGGGITRSRRFQSAGGGSGGGYVKVIYKVVPGTVYNYSVGTGGTSDNDGNSSWFSANNVINAVGGKKGSRPSDNDGTIDNYRTANGGAIQTTGNLATGTNIQFVSSLYASAGSNGTTSSSGSGSSGAGSGGVGGNGISGTSSNGSNGQAGTAPGGGGSGARNNDNTSNRSGGAGGRGQIVITYIVIQTQPASVEVCEGTNTATFTVGATDATTWQWQEYNGSTWSNITNSGIYSGATTASLTLTNATTTLSGYKYRCLVNSLSYTNEVATLTFNPTPTSVTISPVSSTICNGEIQSLVASGGTNAIVVSGAPVSSSGTLQGAIGNPIRTGFGASKCQVIYTASELTAAGFSSGSIIDALSLNVTAVGDTRTGFTISYKYQSASTFSNTTMLSGFTSVFSLATLSPSVGTNTYTFTTPTTSWNGTDNIVFNFCFSNNVSGNTSPIISAVAATTGNTVLQVTADNTTSLCSSTTGTLGKTRPYILLSGTKLIDGPFTWTPITGLYTNSGATTAYTLGTSATTVYAKPTTTITYTATATSSAGCTSTKNVEVTVNQPSVAPTAITGTTTICNGSSTTLTANGTLGTGANYEWGTGSNVGTNPISGQTSASITVSPTSNTTYWVRIVNTTSPCTATTSGTTSTVTVNTTPNAPTGINGYASIPACTTSTAVPVNISADAGLGNTVNWYAAQSGGSSLVASPTNTYSPSITQTTTYYAESLGGNGCASLSRTAVQAIITKTNSYTGGTSGTNTDWFIAGNWSCGVPEATTNVVIPTGKTVSIAYRPNQIGAAAYTVTLQGNASLTVTEDHNLTVTNKVTVASGATFTVENDASLVQTDNVTNEGSITVQKLTPSNRLLKRFDAVLWSSPVVQNLRAISTGTPDAYFMQHNPQANSWSAVSSPATADFTKGKGFLVRTPSTFPTTATQQWNVTFTGVPNNGNVTISAGNTGTSEKYLLVGNPYPSAISIAAFRAANPNITGVFYFFRKPNGVTGISSYGTLSLNNSFSPNDNGVGAVSPGSVIPSGQGFFVAIKSNSNNGEVYFTNAMRVANDHGTFNRMNTNLDTYRLIVQTPVGGNSQFITNYDAETTSGYDVGYDAIAFTDGTTDLSMIMNSKNYRIQSRGAYNAADVIPVQFKTATAGEHRIKLQDAQGVFAADQMVIIKDNLTGVQHNLTANGDYVFTATAGTFTNRFEVIYQQAYYTALQANSCGATIANMNSLVYADLINGATGYRFKVVNNTTAAVQTIDRPQHWFAFNMLSAYDYNTPYTISVQVQKDGVWTGYYGATCTVNSPNIATTGVMQINPSQCGITLPTLGTVIATTPVAGATGYKFRITNTTANASGTNMVQEITRSNHWFTLAMLSRYNYGSSYTVEVAVKTTGAFTPYGNACTVYSPSAPTLASCGQTVATATTLVRTTAMTLATQYRFQVTRMSTQETITFDTANFWFSFRVNVPGYAAGEQYAVRVAVMTAGAWSPYGDACDITAPIATARTTEEAAPSEAGLFKPVAYPNPFASTFGISLATPSADVVHVMVYDLQGRLIEKQNVFVSQLDSLQIGTNYPSGDYLLVVAQGANIKSSHIHKD